MPLQGVRLWVDIIPRAPLRLPRADVLLPLRGVSVVADFSEASPTGNIRRLGLGQWIISVGEARQRPLGRPVPTLHISADPFFGGDDIRCTPVLFPVGGGMARGRLLVGIWITVKACGLGRGLLDYQCAVDQVGQALEVCTALCIDAGILHFGLYALEGAQVVGAVYRGIG